MCGDSVPRYLGSRLGTRAPPAWAAARLLACLARHSQGRAGGAGSQSAAQKELVQWSEVGGVFLEAVQHWGTDV